MVGVLLASSARVARADDGELPVQPDRHLRSTADLDDDYLWLGPVGAAVTVDGAWDSAFGAELAWVRVHERAALGALGIAASGVRYTAHDGGQLRLEALLGTRQLPGLRHALLGITAGPTLEVATVEHPRPGATAAVWAFLGVTPYVRAGWVAEAGAFVELGVAIALPVLRR